MLFKFKYISKSCVLYISGGCNFDKQEIFITFCAEDEQTMSLVTFLKKGFLYCFYIFLNGTEQVGRCEHLRTVTSSIDFSRAMVAGSRHHLDSI